MRSLVLDSVLAGSLVMDQFNDDPAVLGIRVLELKGQSIDATDPEYEKLIERTYVGDDNNDTAEGFYRADSSDGTNRSTTGDYFILPDARGTFLRATGANSILEQPGGDAFEGPEIGFSQNDQMQGHWHDLSGVGTDGNQDRWSSTANNGNPQNIQAAEARTPISDGTHGTPRTGSETRPVNIGCHVGVRY